MNKRLVVHRLANRALALVLRPPARRHDAPPVEGPVRFLLMDLHSAGGYVRSNLLLASGLARHHPVEVLTAFVLGDEPFYRLPDGVDYRVLDDRDRVSSPGPGQRLLSRLPSLLAHPDEYLFHAYSLWTDVQLVRSLRALDGGWLITTRPSLHLLAARFAPPGVVVIAREHDNFTKRRPSFLDRLAERSDGVDAVSVLNAGDERDYRGWLGPRGVAVFRIPNALEPPEESPAQERSTTILAAGRLTPQKGFDLLLKAFAPVAAVHPEWSLRVFGDGPRRADLEAQAEGLGLAGSVQFRPTTRTLGQEMAGAGLFVLSSRFEGFGRVVLEALSQALPVVSFDCPRGPGEILTDGHDGLLVPAEDVAALSAAILQMIDDEALRHRLGAAGPATAARYDVPTIATRWEAELAALVEARRAEAAATS